MKRCKLLVVVGLALAGLFAVLPAAASAACTGVSDWSDLSTAFTNGGSVTLCASITAPAGDSLTVGDGSGSDTTAVTLDLNGFALEIDTPPGGAAAIDVPSGASLTIQDSVGSGTLTVTGASGGAGIGGDGGGNTGGDAGTVTIDAGTVTATGGGYGAGIGGGVGNETGGDGGTVTIDGGTVIATGGSGGGGAGIGGGVGVDTLGGDGGSVSINGGTVTAAGASEGVGLGGGGSNAAGGAGGVITIDGGSVSATGGPDAVGIGGGITAAADTGGQGATVTIGVGATVTAAGPFGSVGGGYSLNGLGAFGSLSNSGSLTIPSGASLNIPSGVTADNSGTLDLSGSLAGEGTVDNTGLISVGSGGSVSGNGDGDGTTSLLVETDNYGLSFNDSGGSGTTPGTMYVYAGSVTASGQSLPAGPTPPAGGTFTGWFTTASGGTQVTNSSTLSSALGQSGPDNVTLYAHYTGVTQTITFAPLAPTATPGTSTNLSATGGGSGLPVTFSAGPGTSPADACTVSQTGLDTGSVTFAHVGTCVIDADELGNGTYAAAATVAQTVSVGAIASQLTLSNPATVVFGQPTTITATVSEADSSAPLGTVQFELDGQNLGTPVSVGPGHTAVSPTIGSGGSLVPGAHTVSATFTPADTSVYAPGSASTTQTVNQAASTTAVTVQPGTITATVAPVSPGAGTPTGTVTFSVDGTNVGSGALSNGTATLSYAVPSGKTHQIAAAYAGNSDFTGSSASTSRSDPAIAATLSSAHPKTADGWYRSPVTVTFACTANGAPLAAACPSAVELASNGAGQSITRTITATNGGAGTVVVSGIDIDQTRPTVKLTGARSGATYVGSVRAPRCVAKDSVSGIASCKLSRHETSSGRGLDITTVRYTATATSRAGNTTTASVTYHLLGIYVQGARYQDGTFLVTPGRTYTIVVAHSSVRPRYIDAAPSPVSPAGNDELFASVGHDRWAQGVTIPSGLLGRFKTWSLGVQIGSKLYDLKVATG